MAGGIALVAKLAFDRVSCWTLLVRNRWIALPISGATDRSLFAFSPRMMSAMSRSGLASMSPGDARRMFRSGDMNGKTTSGFCLGYIQANIAILPSELAQDFERFCQLNEAPCPVLYCSKPGEFAVSPLAVDSDIRTDLTKYCVSENGVPLDREVFDLSEYPWDNFVTFYIGCSFSFEEALINSGVPVQNIARGRQVSMFTTSIPCHSVGPFNCSMVVSMRPIPKELVEKAVQITAEFDKVHGAPIHIGDPQLIGIQNICEQYFGEASELEQDDVPVFWACGVTSSLAVRSAEPKISFSHSPGCMYISDVPVEEFFSKHKPSHGSLVPKVVVVTDNPLAASVLSDVAVEKIKQLETIIQDDPNNRGIKHLHLPDELVKAALKLSHCTSVGITTGFPCNIGHDPPDENDGPPGALAMAKALQCVGKSVSILVRRYNAGLYRNIVSQCVDCGILKRPVPVVEYSPITDKDGTERALDFLFPNGRNQPPQFDMLVAIEAAGRSAGGRYNTMRALDMSDVCGSSPVDELFQAALTSNVIGTVGIGDGGNEIGMGKVQDHVIKHIPHGEEIACCVAADQLITAGVSNWGGYALATSLYILRNCPVHSRYVRRGIGKHEPLKLDGFVNSNHQEQQLLELLADRGVYDSGANKPVLAVDGLDFHLHHSKKLEQMGDVAHSFVSETKERKQ